MTSAYIDMKEFEMRPVECQPTERKPFDPVAKLDGYFVDFDKSLNELMNALDIKSARTPFHQYSLALVYGLYYKRNRLDIDWELVCQHFSFRGSSVDLSDKIFSHLQYLFMSIRCLGDGFSSVFMSYYSDGIFDDWLKDGGWEKVCKIFTFSLPIMIISIKPRGENQGDWPKLLKDGRECRLKMMDIFDEATRLNIKNFNVFQQ